MKFIIKNKADIFYEENFHTWGLYVILDGSPLKAFLIAFSNDYLELRQVRGQFARETRAGMDIRIKWINDITSHLNNRSRLVLNLNG